MKSMREREEVMSRNMKTENSNIKERRTLGVSESIVWSLRFYGRLIQLWCNANKFEKEQLLRNSSELIIYIIFFFL